MRVLEQGKRYALPNGEIVECLEVNWSWAVVRPVNKQAREFIANGRAVSFEAPASAYIISSRSVIPEVERGSL
jgi:hypothetical protein